MQKSKKAAIITEIGNITRGKYICFNKLELLIKLDTPEVNDVAKNIQGKRAQ